MAKIKAVELDGHIIYMQVDEDLSIDNSGINHNDDDFERKGDSSSRIINNLSGLVNTMTKTMLNSITEASSAEVDKISLEFSVKLSSEAGFFIASGKAEGSVKVSVDLCFPKK